MKQRPSKLNLKQRVQKLINDDDMSPDLAREIVRLQMSAWAARGGRARAHALPPERRRAIAKLANAARWSKGDK